MSTLKQLRKFLPFPGRKRLRNWFPDFETRNIHHIMQMAGVDGVFDIGANTGQFHDRLRSAGYAGPIVSVEPASIQHAQLCARAGADPNWIIWPRVGVGAEPGEARFHIGHDTSLSSFLPHHDPRVGRAEEVVSITTLDAIYSAVEPRPKSLMIKIDVQGFEMKVIDGGAEALAAARCCFIELSFLRSYEGESSYLDILARLDGMGFVPVFVSSVLRRKKLGIDHAADMLLLKRNIIR